MEYILITNDINIASYAQDCGVHRIMVDLEIKGKYERQKHLNTLISHHTIQDVERIRRVLNISKLQVRINPIDNETIDEIRAVTNIGADYIMLPMFTSVYEVQTFISLINKNAKSSLLLETPQAMVRIDEIMKIDGIDEIHVGLNDLHIGLKLDFMFELLSGGIVEYLSNKIRHNSIKFGFGGIARLKNGLGLVDPALILSEHYRLNSEIVILSRDFFAGTTNYKDFRKVMDLKKEINDLNQYYKSLHELSHTGLMINKEKLNTLINQVIKKRD